ncbi:hypothetical protein B5S28_g2863 [[Candida] boidinii]|nr:hypothetical protein B5S28_g2863 [[Candida] boidinii]
MRTATLIFTIITLIASVFSASTIHTNSGCVALASTSLDSSNGFNIKFYSTENFLPSWSGYFESESIYRYYTTMKPYLTIDDVQGYPYLTYPAYPKNGGVLTTWGVSFDVNNVLIEFTTYFKPDTSGLYQFEFGYVDNSIMVFIGENAFACCDGTQNADGSSGFDYFIWIKNQMKNTYTQAAYYYFEADILYPIRIVYVNEEAGAKFLLKAYLNDAEIDLSSHLWLLPATMNITDCQVTSVTYTPTVTATVPCFDCSTPVTITTSLTNGIEVLISEPVDTITTIIPCFDCVPITILSTAYTTNSNGTSPIVDIIVSQPVSTSFTTVPCPTCTKPVTITYESVITSGTDGPTTVVEIVVSQTVSIFTTTVPCLTCSGTVTISTQSLLSTGTAPVTVPEVIVMTPVSTFTTTVPCLTCSGTVTISTQSILSTGTAPVTVPEVIVMTPVSTFTTTVPCLTCSGTVTISTQSILSTGTAPVTVPEIIVMTPVSTLTTTSACATCTSPATISTEVVISTGSTPVTVPEVIIITPVSTLTTTSACATCSGASTISTMTVLTTGSTPVTVPEVIITPVSTLTNGFHFSNSSMVATFDLSSINYMYSVSSYNDRDILSSSTKVTLSVAVESQGGYVTLRSTLAETTLTSGIYNTSATTVDILSATESLSRTTESLDSLAVTTTDLETIKLTVSCSSTTASVSISAPEVLVGSISTISYISEPTTSGSVSESFITSNGASFTAERRTTMGTNAEYFTLSNPLPVESAKTTTTYQGQTQGASVLALTESNVLLSSSYANSDTTESLTEYTGGSTDGKSNRIFKFLLAVVCVILFI